MRLLERLYPYLKPYRRRLVLSLCGVGAFTLLGVLPPLLLRILVDDVLEPGQWQFLPVVCLAMLLLPLSSEIVRFVNMNLLVYTSRRFLADLRLAAYRKILHLSMRYHSEHPSGSLVSRLMDDVNMVQSLISGSTMQILMDVTVLLFALGVALTISVKLSVLLLIMLALYIGIYKIFARSIHVNTQRYRSVYDRITGRLSETVEGVRHVRIYNREQWETEMFMERTDNSLDRSFRSSMSAVGLSSACGLVSGFGTAIIMGLGAYLVLTSPMTYGDLLAFSQYSWLMLTPAVRLATVAGQLQETFVSLERVLEVLEENVDIRSPPAARAMPDGRGAVEFRDMHFSYEPGKPLFTGLNLHVEPGMTVALVGPTGCGKTTLISLLMRYWDPEQGQIHIDGVDICTADLRTVRRLFGVVPQRPQLFTGTLAQNIAYGKPDATPGEIEAAAEIAEIGDLTSGLKDGLDTLIGTDGLRLSVGERQRVSIARAIVTNPRILIMDEATSALDSHSEALIQKALSQVLQGRTSFVVAHRLSTIRTADRIVVMDGGRIVECGRHEELMTRHGGLYRQLYRELQNGANEAQP